ncbi:MAG: hypothetical protein RMJ83_06585 [Armatimonadota bacterium]|nr:hypothetical protein [Armatimonadota bacterium]
MERLKPLPLQVKLTPVGPIARGVGETPMLRYDGIVPSASDGADAIVPSYRRRDANATR